MAEFVYVDGIHVVPNTTIDGARSHYLCLSPSRGGEFGVKFSLREIGRIFHIKIRNFKLWKMPK